MYHTALKSGISWHEIEGMTAEDISLAAYARGEENEEFAKILAWIIYNGAALTGVAVNDPKKFPKLEDAFPSLFEKERDEQQNWLFMKERVEDYAKMRKKLSL